MKVLAIDYGDARTGIAISDYTGLLVGTTDVIHSFMGRAPHDRGGAPDPVGLQLPRQKA